jgi:hypothetical protein
MKAEVTDNVARLAFNASDAALVLHATGTAPNHEEAYGRIAFACPASEVRQIWRPCCDAHPPFVVDWWPSLITPCPSQLEGIQKKAEEGGHKVLTPLVSLDTPGKATVQVVILADPVCVGGAWQVGVCPDTTVWNTLFYYYLYQFAGWLRNLLCGG